MDSPAVFLLMVLVVCLCALVLVHSRHVVAGVVAQRYAGGGGPPQKAQNIAIRALGIPRLRAMLARGVELAEAQTVVSVGAGHGSIEAAVIPPGTRLVLIDPDPGSYQQPGGTEQSPDYPTVSDALSADPTLKGQVMFLNYADPNEEGSYDVAALRALKPRAVVVVTEKTGSANSPEFHDFMADPGAEGYRLVDEEKYDVRATEVIISFGFRYRLYQRTRPDGKKSAAGRRQPRRPKNPARGARPG